MAYFVFVIERSLIHFFSSAGVVLLALYGFWMLERKVSWWPRTRGGWWDLVLPALVSFTFISFREVFDVASGGSPVKSVCDWLSWLLGMGVSIWAIYRLFPRLGQILGEIQKKESGS